MEIAPAPVTEPGRTSSFPQHVTSTRVKASGRGPTGRVANEGVDSGRGNVDQYEGQQRSFAECRSVPCHGDFVVCFPIHELEQTLWKPPSRGFAKVIDVACPEKPGVQFRHWGPRRAPASRRRCVAAMAPVTSRRACSYTMAIALAGDPTPPVMLSGLQLTMHSYTPVAAQSAAKASRSHSSPRHRPISAISVGCIRPA